jgi:hydrogenase 3 maturation protease
MNPEVRFALDQALTGAQRIAVLGVGSDLRGDDAVGILVASDVERRLAGLDRARVFLGHTAPENFTGAIRAFAPTHLVAIDAGALGKAPGEITVLRETRIGGASFCTHALPLDVMFTYLREALPGLEVVVVAIEPESTAFGKPVSAAVSRAARSTARGLADLVKTLLSGRQEALDF